MRTDDTLYPELYLIRSVVEIQNIVPRLFPRSTYWPGRSYSIKVRVIMTQSPVGCSQCLRNRTLFAVHRNNPVQRFGRSEDDRRRRLGLSEKQAPPFIRIHLPSQSWTRKRMRRRSRLWAVRVWSTSWSLGSEGSLLVFLPERDACREGGRERERNHTLSLVKARVELRLREGFEELRCS